MRKPFLLTFLLLSITYLTQAQFTAGNLAVFRADAKANNTTVSIIELNRVSAGQLMPVSSYAIQGTGANALRISGSAGTTGYMANSNDGTLLCFTGHTTTNTADNVNTIMDRGVGTLNAAGTFRLAATYKGDNGQQTRCATTLDNYNLFIADQGGVYTNDATGASPGGNFKSVKAFGGTVFIFQSSTAVPVVGTLSAASGGTITALPGLLPGPDKSVDFYMVSSGSNGSAFDVLYILQGNSATVGAISKYSLVTGSWVSNGTYATSFGGLGLAAEKSGSGFNLYATSGDGTVTANNVIRLTDDAGYNANISITTANNVVLYTAPAGTIMKGIAFAPVVSTSPSVIPSPVSKNFGNIFSGAVSAAQTVTLTGENLSPAAGSLTVTASGTDFEVSNDGIGWGAATTVAYTGGGTTLGSFLVRFAPKSSGAKSGIVTVTGGSLAVAVNVAVSGLGDNSLSLAFSTSTTSYLNPPYVSGTINDAGDPAKQTGIVVTVKENGVDIPAADYTLTASSNNQGVVPDANVAITTADGLATVKIDPFAIGYSDITLTLTHGTDNKTLGINYAASLNPQVTPVSYWPTGIADASAAIALDDDYMIIANDESNLLYVFDRKNSGLPVKTYDFSSSLALTGSSEVDVEAGVRSILNPAKIYWMGSLSNSSNPNYEVKPNRNRVFTVTVSGTGAATSFTFDKHVDNLREELITWGDAHGYDFTNAAKDGTDPKTSEGFNIEGMVFGPDNNTLYIGFRAPLVPMGTGTKALIAPIQGFETWFNSGGPITIGAPIELDLGGRGIRDMIRLSNGNYIIIAGSYDETARGAIFRWTGVAGEAPKELTDMNIAALNVEGVLPINVAGVLMEDRLQVISDNGDNILYGDATVAKDLARDNYKKFSSNILLAPGNVLPVMFEYFTAGKQSKSVVLNWKSAQLEGVERFEILRSVNGTDFTSIGFVSAAVVQTTYSYTDNTVTASGKVYYRIRSIEHGGVTAVTPIRYVDFDSQLPLITLYPNPVVNNRFSILADKSGTKTVAVYNSNGTLVRQLIINGQVTDISTTGWPKGWYLINIKTVDGAAVTYKVIVP